MILPNFNLQQKRKSHRISNEHLIKIKNAIINYYDGIFIIKTAVIYVKKFKVRSSAIPLDPFIKIVLLLNSVIGKSFENASNVL